MKKPQPASRILLSSASNRAQVARGRFLLAAGSAFLLILSFTLHREASPTSLPAILLTTVGCVGLVWCGIQIMRDWHQQLQSEAEAGHRHARRQARQQRVAAERAARDFLRQRVADSAAVSMESRNRKRLEKVQQHEHETQFRSRHENALLREAERIAAITESELHFELMRIWELRGWRLVSRQPLPDLEGTLLTEQLLMSNGSGKQEVILLLADGNRAGVSEIEMAERQRIEMNAQSASLLSRNGFTPQAVRLAPRFPLTLVEPHLLAQWSLTPASSAADGEPFKAEQNR